MFIIFPKLSMNNFFVLNFQKKEYNIIYNIYSEVKMEKIYYELLEKAKKVSLNTYSPYSNFPVGACVLYESGNEYVGCNVENASYGLTVCAERNAISTAIANNEKTKIKAIAIYSPKQAKCMPCGACRQWISEFASKDEQTKIILEDNNNELVIFDLEEIFPSGFKFEK
jgi:cytidine deaminase